MTCYKVHIVTVVIILSDTIQCSLAPNSWSFRNEALHTQRAFNVYSFCSAKTILCMMTKSVAVLWYTYTCYC